MTWKEYNEDAVIMSEPWRKRCLHIYSLGKIQIKKHMIQVEALKKYPWSNVGKDALLGCETVLYPCGAE